MSDSANSRQIAGSHYQGTEYQHWDFVIDAALPYLEAQITRYLDRHARKNGREDVEKALHYSQKLREALTEGRAVPTYRTGRADALERYFSTRPHLTPAERECIRLVTMLNGTAALDHVISLIQNHILPKYEGAAK